MMKGLILKDFYTALSYAKMIGLYALIFGGIAIFTGNISFVSTLSVVMIMSITTSSFTYDEFYHWERYAAAAPVSRRQIVAAKYCFFLLLSGLALLVSALFAGAAALIHPGVSILEGVVAVLAGSLCAITLISLAFPLIYKFGSQKGRGFMLLFFGLAFLAVMALAALLRPGFLDVIEGHPLLLALAAIAGCMLVVFLSYLVSTRIYGKKELK